MSFLTDLIQVASGGVASHYEKKIRNRDDDQQYKKNRSRALDEEKERRSRALKYDSEDYQRNFGRKMKEDQIAHDVGLVREEGQYHTKRSRALNERSQDRTQALKWGNEDKASKLAIAKDLAKKYPDDSSYLGRATAGIHGIEKPLSLAPDGSLIGANGKTIRGSGISGANDLYKRRKMVSEEMERLLKTLQVGQGLDDFGNPSGVPLSEAQKRVLMDELTNLQGEYSSLSQTIQSAGQTNAASPLQSIMEGFVSIFGNEPESTVNTQPNSLTQPTTAPAVPSNQGLTTRPVPAALNPSALPVQSSYREGTVMSILDQLLKTTARSGKAMSGPFIHQRAR